MVVLQHEVTGPWTFPIVMLLPLDAYKNLLYFFQIFMFIICQCLNCLFPFILHPTTALFSMLFPLGDHRKQVTTHFQV